MMAAKSASGKGSKTKHICAECKTEFTGTECPECGNRSGNLKLAPDGIDQGMHKGSVLFGLEDVQSMDELYDSERLMQKRQAQMQLSELEDNLRRAYVLKSKIRLDELEMEKKKREAELRRVEQTLSGGNDDSSLPPRTAPQQPSGQYPGQPPDPMSSMIPPALGAYSPQQVFLTQLLKMDKAKRAEFIEQLSDADPQALASLSAMLSPQSPAPSPYGMPPMYPPWMMQPPPQNQQGNQKDPIEIATSLITTLHDMLERSRPKTDDSLKESFRDIREELKRMQDRIENVTSKERSSDLEPLFDKINSLEKKISDSAHRTSPRSAVKELKELISELEEAGLAVRSGKPAESVDDKIKLEEFKLKKELKEREAELERQRVEAEAAKADVAKGLLSALLKRSLQKASPSSDNSPRPLAPSVRPSTTPQRPSSGEIAEEIHTDGGVVKEIRPAGSKKGE